FWRYPGVFRRDWLDRLCPPEDAIGAQRPGCQSVARRALGDVARTSGRLARGGGPAPSILAALFSCLRGTPDRHAGPDRLGVRQYRECVAGAAHARKLDGIAGGAGFCTYIASTGSPVVRGVCSRPLGGRRARDRDLQHTPDTTSTA